MIKYSRNEGCAGNEVENGLFPLAQADPGARWPKYKRLIIRNPFDAV